MYPSPISPNSNILCNNSKILNQEKDINTILLTRLETLFTFHHQFLHALIVCMCAEFHAVLFPAYISCNDQQEQDYRSVPSP